MERYEELVNSFSRLGKRVSDLSRIRTLLEAVGNPQNELRFVHLAGTNGKGSCAQMLADALAHEGFKTGLFTSPYIFEFNDRIRINGKNIRNEQLNELADEIQLRLCGRNLTHSGFSQFEITQAMAMLYFKRQKCDIVVLEAGLGGLLDSTNAIASPLVSVITSISFDHTAILGETIEEIACQKAGIIKCGAQAVMSAENPKAAVDIVRKRAAECGCELTVCNMNDVKAEQSSVFGNEFEYKGQHFHTAMGGIHQIINALTVIECAKALRKVGFDISHESLSFGLEAQVAGRLQVLSKEPLIIVDGGHNPQGIEALAKTLDGIKGKKTAIIGMLSDKDSFSAARLIAHSAERFVTVDDFYERASKREELRDILISHGAAAEASGLSAEQTVREEILKLCGDEGLVICGSLFLAAKFADGRIVKEALCEREKLCLKR